MDSMVIHAFHKAAEPKKRVVEKGWISPQNLPHFAQAPGPNRPKTGLSKSFRKRGLGDRLCLSPQLVLVYNTKTNSYLIRN